jgi:hypothetical protein
MDRIDFNCRFHIEAGLFEAQAQSARTGEQIDAYRPFLPLRLGSFTVPSHSLTPSPC